MTAAQRGDYPFLTQLLGGGFHPYFEESILDPIMVIDDYLATSRRPLSQAHEEINELVERSPDEQSAKGNLDTFLGQAGVPEGDSWRTFLLLVQERIQRAVENPDGVLELEYADFDIRRQRRSSRFTDLDTANDACGVVLRVHEAAVRSWAGDPQGMWRQHYFADVGSAVGTVSDERIGLRDGTTTCTAVVMKLDHESGQPFIYDAWPELSLDVSVRERFPDLCHLFGAYFGAVPDLRWPAQLNFALSTHAPGRRRVAEELDELLAESDDDMRAAVEACGGHVLPQAVRRWVELIRWRIDVYEEWPRNPLPVPAT